MTNTHLLFFSPPKQVKHSFPCRLLVNLNQMKETRSETIQSSRWIDLNLFIRSSNTGLKELSILFACITDKFVDSCFFFVFILKSSWHLLTAVIFTMETVSIDVWVCGGDSSYSTVETNSQIIGQSSYTRTDVPPMNLNQTNHTLITTPSGRRLNRIVTTTMKW